MGKTLYFVIARSRKTGKWKFLLLPREQMVSVEEYDHLTTGRWRYFDKISIGETTYG